MSALTTNTLVNMLGVYSQDALNQYIADMPKVPIFLRSFDTDIANGGQFVYTRLPNTQFQSTPADLTQVFANNSPWNDESASANPIQIQLGVKARSEKFDELQWATVTEANLRNWFIPQLAKQTANDIVVNAISNVTSSFYTNVLTIPSSSNFAITGANSAQSASTALTKNEISREGRYLITTPDIGQSLKGNLVYQLFNQKYTEDVLDNDNITRLSDFYFTEYTRFYGAKTPQGGSKYTGNDKLVGIAGVKDGIVAAVRQPVPINTGTVFSANAEDKTSGLSLQLRLMFDPYMDVYRFAVISVYGTAQGNPLAIVPIITQTV